MTYSTENWKSTAASKKRHGLIIAVLFLVSIALWYLYHSTSVDAYRSLALYPSIMFVFQLPIYFLKHIIKVAESDTLKWFESPIFYCIPLLAIVFWFMFK
jgi:hypothetical protein